MERSRSKHDRLWAAIDAIAARHGLSASGLARRAGLDPTAFNRSKRRTADGRPRWPSTESIAKILQATGSDLVEFVHLIDGRAQPHDGVGEAFGFAEEATPQLDADEAETHRTLRVADDAMLPLYRAGDVLIVSRVAPLRAGDRVVLRLDGQWVARVFLGHGDGDVTFAPPTGGAGEPVAVARIAGLARILWASQ